MTYWRDRLMAHDRRLQDLAAQARLRHLPAPPTRIVVRDGVQVRQSLRPTMHGDRWLDEPLDLSRPT